MHGMCSSESSANAPSAESQRPASGSSAPLHAKTPGHMEHIAKTRATWRHKAARQQITNPIAIAIATGDRDAILRAIQDICLQSNTGCWIPRSTFGPDNERLVHNHSGYRHIAINGKTVALHRLALETATGVKLGKTAAHHVCAVRSCCNPDHLQPATRIQNSLEMMERHSYRHRIADLECALRELNPDHPLLWPDSWSESTRPMTLF